MPWIAAIGSVAGGLLGSSGSSSSGGTPKWLKPYLKNTASEAAGLDPRQFYPGQTSVGALPSEEAAFAQRGAYNQGMFGQGGMFQNVLGTANNQFNGNNFGSQMAGSLSPFATNQVMGAFGQGPGQVGRYGLDPSGMSPQFGQAGSLDATGALNSMLSGTPDYSGAQGAIDAANAPILRQLNEDIIPGLNQKATFLNNPTGGIKTLNRVLPEVGQRMSQNALGVMEGERQRALGAQQNAANMVSQGGLQSYGLGLDRASRQAGLNLQSDTTNAGLGAQFRGDALGLGNLGGNLAGQDSSADARWASMFPGLAQAGQQPSQDAMNYGAFQRMIAENQLGGDMARFNFGQNEPYERNSWLSGILGQLGNAAGPQQPGGSSALGTIGGALTGMNLGSSIASMFGEQNSMYGQGVPMVNQPQGMANVTSPNYNWANLLGQAYNG